jgi:hypothetical protein
MLVKVYVTYEFKTFTHSGQRGCKGCAVGSFCHFRFTQACKEGKRGIFKIADTDYSTEMSAQEMKGFDEGGTCAEMK